MRYFSGEVVKTAFNVSLRLCWKYFLKFFFYYLSDFMRQFLWHWLKRKVASKLLSPCGDTFFEKTFVFRIKLTLEFCAVIWYKIYQTFFDNFSKCLQNRLRGVLGNYLKITFSSFFCFEKLFKFWEKFSNFSAKKSEYRCQYFIPSLLMKNCLWENYFHLFIFRFLTQFFRPACHNGILPYCMKSLWNKNFPKNLLFSKLFRFTIKRCQFFVSVSLRECQNSTLRVEMNLLSRYIFGKIIWT